MFEYDCSQALAQSVPQRHRELNKHEVYHLCKVGLLQEHTKGSPHYEQQGDQPQQLPE